MRPWRGAARLGGGGGGRVAGGGADTRVAGGGLPQLPNGEMLFVGNIVYLNEYMLVGRDESGRLTELFMRVDDEEALPPQ